MARKSASKIDKLPAASRELIDGLLEANATYAEIIAKVRAETQATVTRTGLSRYRTHWLARKTSEEAMAQQLDRLTALMKADPDVDLKQGALALFWQKLIQRMAAAEATFDDANLLELAHLLIRAKRLDQHADALDVQKERLALLKQKVVAAAEHVKGALQSAGVSGEEIAKRVDEILGIAA